MAAGALPYWFPDIPTLCPKVELQRPLNKPTSRFACALWLLKFHLLGEVRPVAAGVGKWAVVNNRPNRLQAPLQRLPLATYLLSLLRLLRRLEEKAAQAHPPWCGFWAGCQGTSLE